MKSDRIKNWPKEERPREWLLAEGADKLTEAELLAIILRVGQGTFKEGMPGQNASDFARILLKDFPRFFNLGIKKSLNRIFVIKKPAFKIRAVAPSIALKKD
jgi:DNA repair protein RadC